MHCMLAIACCYILDRKPGSGVYVPPARRVLAAAPPCDAPAAAPEPGSSPSAASALPAPAATAVSSAECDASAGADVAPDADLLALAAKLECIAVLGEAVDGMANKVLDGRDWCIRVPSPAAVARIAGPSKAAADGMPFDHGRVEINRIADTSTTVTVEHIVEVTGAALPALETAFERYKCFGGVKIRFADAPIGLLTCIG